MDKEMIDKCNMCQPQMKAPTFATLQPHFMRSFQGRMPDLIGQPSFIITVWPLTEVNADVYYFVSITDYPRDSWDERESGDLLETAPTNAWPVFDKHGFL